MRRFALFSDALRQRAERRFMTPERALARRGEDLAHRFLQKQGFRVISRNFRTAAGGNEVDLIAWHQDRLVFIEVKTRASEDDVSAPERAVTPEKQRRIVRAALDFSFRAKVDWGQVRFDVVAITIGRKPAIQHYPDAFGSRPEPWPRSPQVC